VDEGVGQILAALDRRGLLDNTVVIFTSDNGYLHGEHGLYNTKYWPYEESIHVPFVMRYPRLVPPGTVREQMVLNVDVAPTLLSLARVNPPAKFHGRSFLPLLSNSVDGWRTASLAEFFPEKVNPRVPAWQAVRSDRWKYIHYPRLEGMDELYDLSSDPGEIDNRVADPAAQGSLRELQRALKSLLESTR
jgi:N-acetylglucosamine-6-sulfatase